MFVDYLYASASIIYSYILIVSVMRARQHHHKLYLWGFNIFVAGLLLWTITLYAYFYVNVDAWLLTIGRLNYAAGYPMFWGLATFFYAFPEPIRWLPRWMVRSSTYATIGLSIATIATPLIDAAEHMTDAGPAITLGTWYIVFPLFLLVHLCAALVFGATKYTALRGLERLRFQYIFLVFVATASILLIVNAVLPALDIFLYQPYSFLIMLPVAITTLHAMHTHRLFNISYILLRIVRYSILWLFFIIPTVGITMASRTLSPHETLLPILLIASSLGIGSYSLAQNMIPDFLSENFLEMRRRCAELHVAVHSCTSLDELRVMLEKAFVVGLNISMAYIQPAMPRLAKHVGQDLTTWLQTHHELIVCDEYAQSVRHTFARDLKAMHAKICMPLTFEGALIGMLLIGEKERDEPYSKEEIDVIARIRPHLEVCFINMLLKENFLAEKNMMKNIIRDRTEKLRQKNKTMRTLVRQQSDFITTTAHELRTPLTVALIHAEKLRGALSDEDPIFTRASAIQTALGKLNHLIKSLFDMQLFDLQKTILTPEELPLNAYLADMCADYTHILAERNIHLMCVTDTLPLDVTIAADAQLLHQVFQNILSNAREFAPVGSTIEVCAILKNDDILFRIADHGCGVPDASKLAIFEKFHRSTIQSKGIGLGLYLAAQIVKLHGGRLWVEDTAGGGATFCFTIPTYDAFIKREVVMKVWKRDDERWWTKKNLNLRRLSQQPILKS